MRSAGKRARRLAAAQGNRCHYCSCLMAVDVIEWHSPLQATVDHVVPKCRGGNAEGKNVVAACHRCNGAKGDMTEVEFRHFVETGRLHPSYVAWLERRLVAKIRHIQPAEV